MSVTAVPLLDLRRDAEDLDPELEATFKRVLRSGHYVLGPEVEAFERECADYIGTRHAIGVSSGTDALLLALMALGVGPGDEVICPTYTFFATAGVIARVGAKPVFADVRPCCYNIDLASAQARFTPRTKAIIPVHLYGQCADMGPLLEWAREKRMFVIEDAAQAIGARYQKHGAGTMGDFGCFSFFPSKNVGALGDAGLVVTNDDDLAERARIMRAHGGKPKYYHQVIGGNFRIDALQAALLRVKMKKLEHSTAQRRRNAASYTEAFRQLHLSGASAETTCTGRDVGAARNRPLLLPVECQGSHIYNQYVVRIPGKGRRDRLAAFLRDRKIGTEVYYPVPMHLQTCFAELGGQLGDHPVSEASAAETLALPIFPGLREEEIQYVVAQVRAFLHTDVVADRPSSDA